MREMRSSNRLKKCNCLPFRSISPCLANESLTIMTNLSSANVLSRTVGRFRETSTNSKSSSSHLCVAIGLLLLGAHCAVIRADGIQSVYASTTPLSPQHLNGTHDDTNFHHYQPITASPQPHEASANAPQWQNKSQSGSKFFATLTTGNDLWDSIIRDCYRKPSFSCFQKNIHTFLNGALEANDVNVTQRLKFFKNQVNYNVHSDAATEAASRMDRDDHVDIHGDDYQHLDKNEIPDESRAAESPIEEVTNSLYGKSLKFVMTHDVELQLPEMVFDGATFKISPRSIEGNGAIVKLELIPKAEIEARSTGKIFRKKFQKFLRSRLVLSFLALLLVVKIIKIKIFWLLPLIVGVGTAKKLLLKFLLFLFPALSHLFKLCSYYQQTYHSTKYHHHHHLINHHHTIVPAWHNEHVSHGPAGPGPELIYTHPPKGHPAAYLHGAPIHETYGPPPPHEHYPNDWESSGPGLGSDYIGDIHRNAQVEGNYFKPNANDANELHTWGLGTTPTPPLQKQQQQPYPPSHSYNINPFLSPQKQQQQQSQYTTKLKLQVPRPAVYTPQINSASQQLHGAGLSAAQIAAQYDPARNNQPLQQQPEQQFSPEILAQLKEALRIQAEQKIVAQQQKILEKQPFVQNGTPIMPKNYDPFYSPLLLKIDKIVEQLGVTDDYCKERLICSMYKDPRRYSPHSNFISAELSRDTSELQPVTNANAAVLRFYRLIQAAREGQEQRDCLQLYPQCSIKTE